MVSEFIKMQCKFTISSKTRGPTILTTLGARQTPQCTLWFCNTNIFYPGCLHSHIMQTMPPCRLQKQCKWTLLVQQNTYLTCSSNLPCMTHNTWPSTCRAFQMWTMFIDQITFAGGDCIFLCLRTYLELYSSVNLHRTAHISV